MALELKANDMRLKNIPDTHAVSYYAQFRDKIITEKIALFTPQHIIPSAWTELWT